MSEPLTLAQIETFRRQGFLVIEKPLIDPDEVKWCQGILRGLFEKETGGKDGRHFDLAARKGGVEGPSPQLLRPSLYANELRKLSYRKTALEWSRQLLGPEANFVGDLAVFKPSRTGGATPWHQDEAFREPGFDYQEISIWIALTDGSYDNAPMAYIPGSHLLGILPHRLPEGANSIECCDGFDPKQASVQPIPAGAMIIHHCRTVHGAPGNKAVAERLSYTLSYGLPPTIRKEFREFPWLEGLRRTNQAQRKKTLMLGGFFPEFLRILKSDIHTHQNFLSMFLLRRINQLRSAWHKDKDL